MANNEEQAISDSLNDVTVYYVDSSLGTYF